jgi:RNA polymerase sigma-70 factor (ECF subfamily)
MTPSSDTNSVTTILATSVLAFVGFPTSTAAGGEIHRRRRTVPVVRTDQDAFRRLVEPYRAQLYAHCYRMLGSLQDAEDALQDTLLRAWRGLAGFDSRRPPRPWLYRIATNACLDLIQRRPKRVQPIEPCPDEALALAEADTSPAARYERREAVELAFVVALQHLPARQRAVLILRDVLDFSAREVAESLETTSASVNSALQRARKTIDERLPSRSQQANRRALGDERARRILQAYIDAWERRDVDAILALLAEDATFTMPPYPSWWRGRDDIAHFLRRQLPACGEVRSTLTRANGQPAVAWYVWDARKAGYVATSIDVPSFEGPFVKDMVTFVSPELFPRFGLPARTP